MTRQDSITPASRLFLRHQTLCEARVAVHPEHADQFRLSFPDALTDFRVVDVSKGGLGLHSAIFLPKNLRLILTVTGTNEQGEALPRPLTIRAIVRRCTMVDHRPSYIAGLQFADASGSDEKLLVRFAAKESPQEAQLIGTKG